MIELNTISKSYGSKHVLKGLDASFKAGHIYGVVGNNGAGKTTLFRCLCGLEKYDGTVSSPHKSVKAVLGYLPTTPFFFKHLTGKEYLTFMLNARNIPVPNFEEKDIFNLPLDEYAANYSTGMKKKLALLGLLLQNNDVFVLDEPFNGVDISSNMLIVEILNRLREKNKTILISSHIFSTLTTICDSVFILNNGRFEKQVPKADFSHLEDEMKAFSLGDKLGALGLD